MSVTWKLKPRATLQETEQEGAGVLFDSHNAAMFSCNETAWSMLQALRKGAAIDDISGQLAEAFDVPEEVARRDAEMFVAHLKRMGLADAKK